MKKIFNYTFSAICMLLFVGCQNNNELNLNTLKINVTLNTPIDLDNSGWLSALFQSFQIGNVNYVSRNNNNKIGINIMRGDLLKKIYAVNLPLHDGNGIKLSMDVYDNANLSDDLGKFDLKYTFIESNLSAYVTKQFTGNVTVENKNNTIVIDINNPISEAKLKKEITSLISKSKNQCVINVVVNKSDKKSNLITPKSSIDNDPVEISSPSDVVNPIASEVKSEVKSKVNAEFKTPLGLKLKYDLNVLSWHNFGDITYKIEFIDYVTGKVCCKIDDYKSTKLTAKYLLNEVNCISFNNRYIIKISTNAKLKGFPEKVTCCSIGFQSGGFSEDCSCDNTCE